MLVHNTKFVEMLDKKDSIVWQEKYPVQADIADGHIYIDKELNPGRLPYPCLYQILLFGRYYRSFYPKKIRIVKTIANKGYDSSVPPDTRVAKLTFFPEGGNLIEGIPAKMAFKALNEKGIYGIKVFSQNNCHTIIVEFI